jgi:hypothetical protein
VEEMGTVSQRAAVFREVSLLHTLQYGDSVIMTFVINQNVAVFEKDLGKETGPSNCRNK